VECSLQDAAARPELCSFVARQSPAPAAPFRSRVKSQDHDVRTVRCWLLGFRERKHLPSAVNALRHAMPCHAMLCHVHAHVHAHTQARTQDLGWDRVRKHAATLIPP
jgi:hypothetical protein